MTLEVTLLAQFSHSEKQMPRSTYSALLVTIQFGGVLLCLLPLRPAGERTSAWLLLALVGVAIGVITLGFNRLGNFNIVPEVREQARLITGGPYRWVRHPMYVALFVTAIGLAFYNGHWINFVGLLLVGIAVVLKALREEQLMRQRFPEYEAYARQTSRFVPRVF